MSTRQTDAAIERAAAAIASADALLIAAGAGMGVDSGLPDFRGDEGFWNAYPPFRGKKFAEISTPHWFDTDPPQAWGFFGHRLELYRRTTPHRGFKTLRTWAEERPSGYFVFTSNVDGHFQQSGFPAERILECHGSLDGLQCSIPCSEDIWPTKELELSVDEETIRATKKLPTCIHCGAIARPNVLMFGDLGWNRGRHDEQEHRYVDWLAEIHRRFLVVIEIGAGTAVPTVRRECEQRRGKLIRVNPREPDAPERGISIPLGAIDAIERIDSLM